MNAYILSFIIGFVPCLLWVWFWLKEDRDHVEPRRLILASFLVGAISVAFVIPTQAWIAPYLKGFGMIALFSGWSAIEELFKFLAAELTVLRHPKVTRALDPVILMIVVALGFAAVENFLFLLGPLKNGIGIESLVTANFRFIGATLVHIFSSAIIGIFIALSMTQKASWRVLYALVGVLVASIAHGSFNALILSAHSPLSLLPAFLAVWMGVVILLALIEHVKHIHYPTLKKLSTPYPHP
jgi:protease PrsW